MHRRFFVALVVLVAVFAALAVAGGGAVRGSPKWCKRHPQQCQPATTTLTSRAATSTTRPTTSTTTGPSGTTTTTSTVPTSNAGLHVVGNHLVNAAGTVVQLRGVNRSGAEYAAPEGWGIFDGPTDDPASIAALKSWHINAVRVPMSETAWLGINGLPAAYSGANYRAAIVAYAGHLIAQGIIPILNLHYAAPGASKGSEQYPMADHDHAPAFWTSVATTFKTNHAVIFDLFNEPFPNGGADSAAAWTCIRDGGSACNVGYVAAGYQELVNAVRATGATQPLAVGGPNWSGYLDRWLEFRPADPLGQLVASVHVYGLPLDSPYSDPTSWNGDMARVAQTVPVYIGEFGDTDCTARFSPPLMTWADQHGVSYTAWSWVTSNCAGEPSLITNYNGTPTAYGAGVRSHLLGLP